MSDHQWASRVADYVATHERWDDLTKMDVATETAKVCADPLGPLHGRCFDESHDDRLAALTAALADQRAEIARHHRDFEKWEAMADRAAVRAAKAEAEVDRLRLFVMDVWQSPGGTIGDGLQATARGLYESTGPLGSDIGADARRRAAERRGRTHR